MANTVLTDESLMPFGKFKGKKMANLPAWYLLFLLEVGTKPCSVVDYIFSNLKGIKAEHASDARELKMNSK